MLALIQSNTVFVRAVPESGGLTLPNGDFASPVSNGWSSGVYSLRTIAEASPVPADYVSTGITVVITNGSPKYTHTLVQQTLGEVKAERLQELADRRFTAEEGGMLFGGSLVASDRTTQSKVTAAYVKAASNSSYVIESWKFAPGVFSPLNAQTILAFGNALENHVQSCFNTEKVISASIMAAANTSAVRAVDIESGWPPTA